MRLVGGINYPFTMTGEQDRVATVRLAAEQFCSRGLPHKSRMCGRKDDFHLGRSSATSPQVRPANSGIYPGLYSILARRTSQSLTLPSQRLCVQAASSDQGKECAHSRQSTLRLELLPGGLGGSLVLLLPAVRKESCSVDSPRWWQTSGISTRQSGSARDLDCRQWNCNFQR
jgi:hypothetical protein